MSDPKSSRTEKILLAAWLVVNLVIGALTVDQYGMSIDEPNNYRYAADTLAAYPSLFGTFYEPNLDSSYKGHGPVFVAITAIGVRLIQSVFPEVFEPDLWHFSYFLTFLLAGLCLYWLTKRWFSTWTAWGILLLFNTQPLLLGHAFINPKDIPFMSFLTLSVLLGFRLVDRMEANEESYLSLEKSFEILKQKTREADPRRKRRFLVHITLALVVAFVLLVFSHQLDNLIKGVVTAFYTAQPDTWAGQIFSSVASNSSTVTTEDYSAKAIKLFQRVEIGLLITGVVFFLAYFGLLLASTTFPAFLRDTWNQRSKFKESLVRRAEVLRVFISLGSLRTWLSEVVQALQSPLLLAAGAALGLATAVRAIAPLAGVVILTYMFLKVRSRAWTTALAYFLVAGVVTYVAWPYLWEAPIRHYLEELGVVSNFQFYSGRVLFQGQLHGIRDLPRSYLPVLLSIQLTEPLVLAIYLGLGLWTWQLLHNRIRADLLLYVGLGFLLPLLGVILLHSPLYHNFRQVLFIIPAMVMCAAFSLEWVFTKLLVQNWTRLVLITIMALPGIYSSVSLYPYEYVYYNSLVGGTAGANNRFELDYWRTSMQEMAVELNARAPQGAKIVISGSSALFRRYAREDLIVDTLAHNTFDLNGGYDYAVQISRWQNWDVYPNAMEEVVIQRAGAVLATVKAVRGASLK